MKKLLIIFLSASFLLSCATDEKDKNTSKSKESAEKTTIKTNPNEYGKTIEVKNVADARRLPLLMESATEKDIKLIGKVKEVCQMSGCWLDIDVGNDQNVHITFKDEAFVVPKNIAGRMVIVEGVATTEILSVELLKKMAKEENKPQNEIDAITSPATEYYIEATGLIIQ